jgi:hypothetical protein
MITLGVHMELWRFDRFLAYATDMPSCAGPKCNRPAVANELCDSHNRQRLRGRELTPLRERGSPLVHVTTRVPRETFEALGDRPGEKAREILTAWAKRQR